MKISSPIEAKVLLEISIYHFLEHFNDKNYFQVISICRGKNLALIRISQILVAVLCSNGTGCRYQI